MLGQILKWAHTHTQCLLRGLKTAQDNVAPGLETSKLITVYGSHRSVGLVESSMQVLFFNGNFSSHQPCICQVSASLPPSFCPQTQPHFPLSPNFFEDVLFLQMWWYISVGPELRRQRKKDHTFEAILIYLESSRPFWVYETPSTTK